MKRVINIATDVLGNELKYVLQQEYMGFGLYERKTPTGCLVHQDYAITNGNITIISESYNHLDEEELLDVIDEYIESGKFGLKVMKRNGYYLVHPNGKFRI